MSRSQIELGAGVGYEARTHDEYAWRRILHASGTDYTEVIDWRTQSKDFGSLFELGDILREEWASNGERLDLIFQTGNLLVYVALGMTTGWIRVQVASGRAHKAEIAEVVEALRTLFPETVADAEIPVVFWYREDEQASSIHRMIPAPTWPDVRGNYAASTRAGLDRLMNGFRPDARGQLVLWHGEPGTGKTWSLRALAREWKDWCWFEYVTDPENFFGSADYMMQVLMHGNDRHRAPSRHGEPDPWRLLILEDTGEMLAADAKNREGQKLSRLLNIVDGFIGQGLRLLILVTTNEELGSLHPAVSRPGRCGARIEFSAFEPLEAAQWLAARHGDLGDMHESLTLAELYALADGVGELPQKRAVGFAPKG